jgi:hypothetical protein
MDKLMKIDRQLIEIAKKSGNPATLDTPEEKGEAAALLTKETFLFQEKQDARDTWTKVKDFFLPKKDDAYINEKLDAARVKLIDAGSKQLSVNHLFGDEEIYCSIEESELLTEIPRFHSRSMRVYTGNRLDGLMGKDITFTKAGWEYITAPLKELQEKAEGKDPNYLSDAELTDRSDDMMSALADSLMRFEEIAGEKAGTDKDLGGVMGDALTSEVDSADGQQDNIAEFMTTRQAISAFDAAGLLVGWKFEPEDSESVANVFVRGYARTFSFTRVLDETGTEFAIDTWSEDSGKMVEVAPTDVVSNYIAGNIEDLMKEYE